jgi:hypothetical protein
MEPENSLPCSQEPFTGPYSEPDESNIEHPLSIVACLLGNVTVISWFRIW